MPIGSSYESDEIGLMSEALETAQQLINARAEIKRLRDALKDAVQFAEDFQIHRAWVQKAEDALK